MKVGFYNTFVFPGRGVYETERFAWRGGDDTHVANYAVGAVSAGKQDKVTAFSLLQWDRGLNGCKIHRFTGYYDAKMIKHIGDKARTIETFPGIDRAVFVGCADKRTG